LKAHQNRYKFQKLQQTQSTSNEIQVNKFVYQLDSNNKELMSFLGVDSSGTTDMRSHSSRLAVLLKQDRAVCDHLFQRDRMLEALKIKRATKSNSKKFVESMK